MKILISDYGGYTTGMVLKIIFTIIHGHGSHMFVLRHHNSITALNGETNIKNPYFSMRCDMKEMSQADGET
jgi:hypothetical protein